VTGTFTPVKGGASVAVTLFDDGQHNDGEASDGVYGAEVLAGTAGRGAYFFQVEANGVSPSGAAFTRAPSRTFVVTGDGIAVEPYAPFLRALYQGLLKRNADQGGLDYWEQQLQQGVSRAVVIDGFYHSAEHRGLQVDSYYRDYLGRAADAGGRADWIRAFQQGADEFAVKSGFLASPEYARRQGSEQDLVEGLYQDVLGRTGDRDGVRFWLQTYRYSDRTNVAAGFVTSVEHRQRLIDEVYATYLGRAPDRSESDEAIARLKSDRGLGPTLRALLSDDEFVESAI
jgi:hypothetical protein